MFLDENGSIKQIMDLNEIQKTKTKKQKVVSWLGTWYHDDQTL